MIPSCLIRPAKRKAGFTLVELLVVIGIIAVLVGILLPALNKARRAAATVQSSSNMKQVASAMMMYINANKGKLPPAVLQPSTAYPNGWWWPNELVRGKHINAPSVYSTPGQTNKVFRNPNVFKCPEGINEDDASGGGGDFPTDTKNNAYRIVNDAGCQAEGFGVVSWYMLTSRNLSGTGAIAASTTDSSITKAGTRQSPFLYFNNTDPAKYSDPAWQRTMSMIRKPSEMVMIVEAS